MRRLIPLLAVCIAVPGATTAQDAPDPPNAPALARPSDSTVALRSQGRDLFAASIARPGGAVAFSLLVDSTDGRVSQILKWTAGRGQLTLTGIVETSEEGFAAEVEPREDGLRVVRHAVGAVANRLNRAVYDRHDDWVLSVDEPAAVTIVPLDSLPGVRRFRLVATGGEVTLRFRPRYFQRHRGLARYRPWTYRPWSGSVAGWTSWYAFKDRVTAEDIRRTADIMARRLLPFGYRYLQIDDGYQQSPIGLPEHWLVPNDKFPGGLAGLRESISARGLEPGIWTNVSFQDSAAAAAHPGWFVPGPDGRPARGRWVG